MKNIAIFASGVGSNFQAIVDAVREGTLHAHVALLVSDKPECYAVTRAREQGIDVFTFKAKDYVDKVAYEQAIVNKLEERKIDYVVLAGYMRIVGNTLLSRFPQRIINLHPALLPSFPGAHGIEDAYNYGVRVFGITIHYVDAGVDTGKIIDQFAFHADDGMSLCDVENSIHELEHRHFPATIHRILNG